VDVAIKGRGKSSRDQIVHQEKPPMLIGDKLARLLINLNYHL
jgi:hypothetical protein